LRSLTSRKHRTINGKTYENCGQIEKNMTRLKVKSKQRDGRYWRKKKEHPHRNRDERQ